MAAGRIVLSQYFPARDRNGRLVAGARLFVYADGTTTKAPIYANQALTTALANPVEANASGQFPAIWAPDDLEYTLSITGPNGESIGNPSVFDGYSVSVDAMTEAVTLAENAAIGAEANYQDVLAIQAMGSDAAAIATRAAKSANLGDLLDKGEAKDNLFLERTPFDFGVVGNGVADDTAAWQDYIDWCRVNRRVPRAARPIKSRITDTITILPPHIAVGIGANVTVAFDLGNVVFMYDGPRDRVVLDSGTAPNSASPGTNAFIESRMVLPSVVAAGGTISWPVTSPQGSDTAIRIRRAFRCDIHYGYVVGFSKGVELNGVTYCKHYLQHIVDCKFSLVLTSEGTNIDDSFTNENTFFGGRLGHTSNSNGKGAAAGVVFTWDKVASYRGQNCNRFLATCFESGGVGSGADRIPVWFDGAGLHNVFRDIRNEGNFGVMALCDGAGSGQYASANEFSMLYGESAGLSLAIQQVGGASGNIVTGPRSHQSHWHSGDMGKLVHSSGDAKAAIRGREFFFGVSGTFAANTPSRVDPVGGGASIRAHRNAVLLDAGGYARVGVAIDTSILKDFLCSYATVDGTTGRPCFAALDANGNLLSGAAAETAVNPFTGAPFAIETYVKANGTIAPSSIITAGGGSYQPESDLLQARAVFVTVRPEVKTLLFMVVGGSAQVGVQGMSVTSFGFANKIGSAYPNLDGLSALRVFSPLDDGGDDLIASANPATAGAHGFYRRGQRIENAAAASGQPTGWICTTAGWLARAWSVGTAYPTKGALVINDSGKAYELVTPGTSAGSGGPTGTGTNIADGGCVWKYIGVKAAFASDQNLA